MGHKAVETTRNVNNLAQKQLTNTLQWRFKKFCKGDESLENEEHTGQLSEVDNDKLREIIEADPLTATHEVTQELNIDHSPVMWHLKQTGMVKSSISWCLVS